MAGAVLILVPAAGASRRMRGRDKLTEPVEGQPVLRRQVRAALATGATVLVTLPRCAYGPRAGALEGLPDIRVAHVDAAEGMSASIRAGAEVAASQAATGLLVLLPDMPGIQAPDILALLSAFAETPDRVVRAATEDGWPGHPAILPARLFPALAALTGDTGARGVLTGEAVRLVPLPGDRAVTDLDTPEAWAEWRARTGL